jgi:CubicO group peptidase (beta-lactamase class C family)
VKTNDQAEPYAAIDAYVERRRRSLNIPGVSLAIVEGDRVAHLRGFGRARAGGGPPAPSTPFYIGSLTKSFTALAVMQLVEAGKVALDASIQCYLPWFRVADVHAAAQITVRHLLTQTSGLPGLCGELILADFDQSPGAAGRQARALCTEELAHPPGTAWEYCNSNYQLLGLVIEAASGQAYADYVEQHIFTPLGMHHTTASPAVAARNGLATGYQYCFGLPVAAGKLAVPLGALAGGGLISTAADLARYLIAQLNGGRYGDAQLLSRAGMEALQRGAAEVRVMGILAGLYGMGWFDGKLGPTRVVWHSGTLPHFGAYLAQLPEHKQGVVMLFNACQHWMNPVLVEFGTEVLALLAGQPPPARRFGLVPWALRALPLIPLLQAADVLSTLGRLRRWRRRPDQRPACAREWARHALVPLVYNLLLALSLKPLLGRRRSYLQLYMPDYALIAWFCGSFALLWGVARTGLRLRVLRARNKRLQT